MNRKITNNILLIVSLIFLTACVILVCFNVINIVHNAPINELFIIALPLMFVGILCLILTIKKVFHWWFNKIYPTAEKAEERGYGRVGTEKGAYNTLMLVTIVLFGIVLILLTLSLII